MQAFLFGNHLLANYNMPALKLEFQFVLIGQNEVYENEMDHNSKPAGLCLYFHHYNNGAGPLQQGQPGR
jgi:hypothetical protein